MTSYRSVYSFNPEDLDYLDRAFQAAWEHIEQQEPDRERRNDSARQDALRRSVLRIAGCNFSYSRAA